MQVFDNLMGGLETQLGGMGTAFGSSLMGLAGSLIVGLLDLFAGHGQNRFFRELEEWLSSLTAVGAGEEGTASGVVDHIAQQSELMRNILAEVTQRQSDADQLVNSMARSVDMLAQLISSEQSVGNQAVQTIGQGQERLVDLIETATSEGKGFMDEDTRARLRNIDASMLQLLEEITVSQQADFEGLRKDIRALTAALKKAK